MNRANVTGRHLRGPVPGDGDARGSPGSSGGQPDTFEALLERALQVDVPDPIRASHDRATPPRRTLWRWPALAAGLVLVVGVAINLLRQTGYLSTGDFAKDVVVHIHHESHALVRTNEAVSDETLEGVLRAAGVAMGPVGAVSYVKLCPFRGEMVAHMVVQGEQGPVTVLLLPEEALSGPVTVEEDGFVGTIVPLESGGSIAVVGTPGEPIERIQNRVAAAVRWRL